MNKLKCLTIDGLGFLIEKLKIALTIDEKNYYLALNKDTTYTFDVPDYVENKSVVDVHLNGMKLTRDVHYTLSTIGKISMTFAICSDENNLSVTHRKLRW